MSQALEQRDREKNEIKVETVLCFVYFISPQTHTHTKGETRLIQ